MFRPAGLSSDEEDEEGWDYHVNKNETDEKENNVKQEDVQGALEVQDSISGNDSPFIDISNKGYESLQLNGNKEQIYNGNNLVELQNLTVQPSQSSFTLSPYTSLSNTPLNSIPSTPRLNSRKCHTPIGNVKSFDDFRMAIIHGNIETIQLMLTEDFAVDQTLKSGWTGLMYACSSGKPAIVDFLLRNGANPNMHKEFFTALMAACASSQDEMSLLKCVNLLLDFDASVNVAERHRMTSLMFASKEGRLELVKRLIEAGADVNRRDNKGWSALFWACSKGHGHVVDLLLSHSADPTSANNCGQRPADVAMNAGFSELATALDRTVAKGIGESESKYDSLTSEVSSPKEEKLTVDFPSRCLSGASTLVDKCGEVDMILNGIDLEDLIPLFQRNKINLECFLQLTESDLEKMEINEMGARITLLKAIKDMHKQRWETSSLHNLSTLKHITLPDAIAMVKNVNQHIRYIQAQINYLREHIEATPRALELGQSQGSLGTLTDFCGASVKNISGLKEEVKFFKARLDEMSGRAEFSPADLIKSSNLERNGWKRHLLGSLILSTLIATTIYYTKPRIFAKLFSLTPYPQRDVFLDL